MIAGDEHELFGRSLRHATGSHTGAALDAALEELGWRDALAADTRAAVSLLFEAQGAANATSSALDLVLAHALGHDGIAVLLPPVGHVDPPGTRRGTRLDVRGIGTAALGRDRTALVAAGDGGSHVAVEVAAASLPRRAVAGIDPALGLVEVVGQVPGAGTGADTGTGTGEVAGARDRGPVDWRAAVALGQLALGHELVGASRRMLELARRHALDRVQFGQPIARFQAVRHRLAETLVAIEAADAVLDAAWRDRGPQTAAMAKAAAGRAARTAARHGGQVLAGIGFTTEHAFHRYLRRVLVLEQLLGATGRLTRQLGRDVLEQRQLPALIPL